MRMTIPFEEPELCYATIRVREAKGCASTFVAETLSRYTNEVALFHSDSESSGWRRAIAKIPALITREDLVPLETHKDVIDDPKMHIIGNNTWLVLSLKDKALNEVMEMRAVFQKITSHIATAKYEDFHIYLYPARAVDSIVKSLNMHGQASLLGRETMPFIQMPTFKFDLTTRPILTEGEQRLLYEVAKRGWFDTPRPDEAHLAKLAPELGEAEATLSVKLRQINRKLATDYIRRFIIPI